MKNLDKVMIVTNPESGFFKGQGTWVFNLVLCHTVPQDHSGRRQQMNNVVIHFTHYDLKWVTHYICGFKCLVLVSSIVVDGLKKSRNGDIKCSLVLLLVLLITQISMIPFCLIFFGTIVNSLV